jgi:GH15 family glucan-1,4-alpha-glucosidase
MIPLVGFLPPSDPRVISTVEAIQRDLVDDGFVLRYRTQEDGSVDGLQGREGAFLACSFWLCDCLHLIGRQEEALALFDRLLALRNDLGLLSEEYDPVAKRLVGNFPQAFSHVSLVNSACRLSGHDSLAQVMEEAARRHGPRLIDRHLPLLPSMSRTARRRRRGAAIRTIRTRRGSGSSK